MTPRPRRQLLGRLAGTTSYGDLSGCDLVIEAIVENVEAKSGTPTRQVDGCRR